jgi:predicted amidohydrolase
VAGVQRKRHLGEGEEPLLAATESHVFERGGTRFGVAICAEAGFDAPFDAAATGGAELVVLPTAPVYTPYRRSVLASSSRARLFTDPARSGR